MIAATLVDSPVANIGNIARALQHEGAALTITSDTATIATARAIVLPGVGSFAAAMSWLEQSGVADALRGALARGASLLGICVGHQALFDSSTEMGSTRGLALLRGEVSRLEGALPVPQIGWNRVTFDGDPLFDGLTSGTPFYFVNSYAARNAEGEIARSDYDGPFTAAVRCGRVAGLQFHPEKSSGAGLRVLRNFLELSI